MHREALAFVAGVARSLGPRRFVVDFGGRDVNGSPREFFAGARYVSVDIEPGRGVDVVGDARTWTPGDAPDTVLCLEVAEHVRDYERIIANARLILAPGGAFIFSAACDPRRPHSAVDGGDVRPGEHYANVDPARLREMLLAAFERVHVETHRDRGDVYAVGWKRTGFDA